MLSLSSTSITFTLDSALLKKCANAEGTYATKCDDTTRRLNGAFNNENENANGVVTDSIWNRYNPHTFRNLVESTVELTGNHIATMAKNSHTRKLDTFERLLASHSGNTDSCDLANNGICEDQSKELWATDPVSGQRRAENAKAEGDWCITDTDTTDCGGMLADSPCKKGECCCHCSEQFAASTEQKDVISFPAIDAPDDLPSTKYGLTSVCPKDTCKSTGASMTPEVCQSSFNTDIRYIGENWNVASGDGCLACCGLDKATTCAGKSAIDPNDQFEGVLGKFFFFLFLFHRLFLILFFKKNFDQNF